MFGLFSNRHLIRNLFLFQEIKLLSNLQHPNIVQYFGSEIVSISSVYMHIIYLSSSVWLKIHWTKLSFISYLQVEDRFFIYLEYVHPGSINKYIRDHGGGTMTESVVRNFTRHILSGLAYLHSKKTVHR